jgi:hypothetical protein
MTEEWRGTHYGYEVSNLGRVRNGKGRIMKLWSRDGRTAVRLVKVGLPQKFLSVGILVCEAWYGPRPQGKDVAHYDCDSSNNKPENLRWATPKENKRDCVRNGCHSKNCR